MDQPSRAGGRMQVPSMASMQFKCAHFGWWRCLLTCLLDELQALDQPKKLKKLVQHFILCYQVVVELLLRTC